LNARHLRMTPQALAEWLAAELERIGAVTRKEGDLVPLVKA
jgi:hypothetical protein